MQVLLLVFIRTKFLPRRAWLLQWGLCMVQLTCVILAYVTGLRDLSLSAGSDELLSRHQTMAMYFTLLWAGVFVVLPLAFWQSKRAWSVVLHGLLLGLLFAQVVLAVLLGQAGGQLVFGLGLSGTWLIRS
jgi:hypothetical protein